MSRISMSKGALRLLPLVVAWCVLLPDHDGAYRQTDAAEAGNRQWKAAVETDGGAKDVNAEDLDPMQPAGCKAHLQRLRNSFIEARHCALEKNPCETAAHASTFLMVLKECQEACPPDDLKQNGFTERIARNMQWLESYSSKKCSPTTP